MKNILCPVSNERIPENLPRITAFFVIASLLAYFLTGFLPIVLFLIFDFFARGFNKPKYSLFHFISMQLISFTASKQLIDKAPKLFAARLGGIMCILIVMFYILNIDTAADILSSAIILLSACECLLGYCVGCYIYSLFILPYYKNFK